MSESCQGISGPGRLVTFALVGLAAMEVMNMRSFGNHTSLMLILLLAKLAFGKAWECAIGRWQGSSCLHRSAASSWLHRCWMVIIPALFHGEAEACCNCRALRVTLLVIIIKFLRGQCTKHMSQNASASVLCSASMCTSAAMPCRDYTRD